MDRRVGPSSTILDDSGRRRRAAVPDPTRPGWLARRPRGQGRDPRLLPRPGDASAWDLGGALRFRDRVGLPGQGPARRGPWRGGAGRDLGPRRAATSGPGVVIMPPSFVNVGAWIGEDTMVDSHVLVGSCAQIGARVHLSAGVTIGGVLEPAGARPVDRRGRRVRRGGCGAARGRPGAGAGAVLGGGRHAHRDLAPLRPRARAACSPARPTRRSPCRRGPWWSRVAALGGEFARANGLSVSVALLVKDRDAGHRCPRRPGGRAAMSVAACAGRRPRGSCASGGWPATTRQALAAPVGTPFYVYDLDVIDAPGRGPARGPAAGGRARLRGEGEPQPRRAAPPRGAGAGCGRRVGRRAAARPPRGVRIRRASCSPGPASATRSSRAAVEAGVRVVTVESVGELRRLERIAEALGRRQPVLLRAAVRAPPASRASARGRRGRRQVRHGPGGPAPIAAAEAWRRRGSSHWGSTRSARRT